MEVAYATSFILKIQTNNVSFVTIRKNVRNVSIQLFVWHATQIINGKSIVENVYVQINLFKKAINVLNANLKDANNVLRSKHARHARRLKATILSLKIQFVYVNRIEFLISKQKRANCAQFISLDAKIVRTWINVKSVTKLKTVFKLLIIRENATVRQLTHKTMKVCVVF